MSQPDERSRHAAYMARWRRDNPDAVERGRQMARVRQRALVRLGQMYPEVLAALVREERTKVGRSLKTPAQKNGPGGAGTPAGAVATNLRSDHR